MLCSLGQRRLRNVSVYDENPERAAERFLQAGIRRLHVVDLDAAKAGHPVNTAVIADIIATTTDAGASVQVGGGLRDMVAVEQMLSVGASYVILGTAAVRNPDFRHNVINAFAERVILGLDAREEHLAVSGWLNRKMSISLIFSRNCMICRRRPLFTPTLGGMGC